MSWDIYTLISVLISVVIAYFFYKKDLFKRLSDRKRKKLYQELDQARSLNNIETQAKCLYKLGILDQKDRRLASAENLLKQSLELVKKTRYDEGIASCIHQMGWLAMDRGDSEQAITHFQEAHTILNGMRSPRAKIAKKSLDHAKKKQAKATKSAVRR